MAVCLIADAREGDGAFGAHEIVPPTADSNTAARDAWNLLVLRLAARSNRDSRRYDTIRHDTIRCDAIPIRSGVGSSYYLINREV